MTGERPNNGLRGRSAARPAAEAGPLRRVSGFTWCWSRAMVLGDQQIFVPRKQNPRNVI
jgi:hypothetical protein